MTDKESFEANGYILYKDVFDPQQLSSLTETVLAFHEQWIANNKEFYQTRAINSSGLTHPRYMNHQQRLRLFRFIASEQIGALLDAAFSGHYAFMNTQLFFDPVQTEQKNYWHRDVQYTDLSEEQQQQAIHKDQVVHLRIPLRAENGLEIIPASHARWDTDEERAVRLEQGEHHNAEDLTAAKAVVPAVGDALLFSAHAIHRGLYGQDRLVLDLVFCDAKAHLLAYVDGINLPNTNELHQLANPGLFKISVE